MADETLHQCSICYQPTGQIDPNCPKCHGTGWQNKRDDVGRYEAVEKAPGEYMLIVVDECMPMTAADYDHIERYVQRRMACDASVIMQAAVRNNMSQALHKMSETLIESGTAMEGFVKAVERHRQAIAPPTIKSEEPVSFSKKERRAQQPWSKEQWNRPWNKKRR